MSYDLGISWQTLLDIIIQIQNSFHFSKASNVAIKLIASCLPSTAALNKVTIMFAAPF